MVRPGGVPLYGLMLSVLWGGTNTASNWQVQPRKNRSQEPVVVGQALKTVYTTNPPAPNEAPIYQCHWIVNCSEPDSWETAKGNDSDHELGSRSENLKVLGRIEAPEVSRTRQENLTIKSETGRNWSFLQPPSGQNRRWVIPIYPQDTKQPTQTYNKNLRVSTSQERPQKNTM